MNSSIQPINPIALNFGPIEVHWYGIIIGFGIALGLWIAMRESKKHGIESEIIADLMIWAIPIAIISARIYYVLFEWKYYSQHPAEIIAIWNGGIAIHGAIIGSLITAYLYTKAKQISFFRLVDILVPSLILGQAIGRWGNFMNQEAHGRIVSEGFLRNTLHLPDFIVNQMFIEGSYYHPTFLYESIWDLLGFILLISLRKANLRRGEMLFTYLIWYSIGRYFVEGMRTDSLMLTSHLRIAQVISLVLIGISILLIVYRRYKGYSNVRYNEDLV